MAKEQKQQAMRQWINTTRPVLWEGLREIEGKTWVSGYTPEFHRVGLWVDAAAAASLPYSIRATEITGFDPSQACLTGHLSGADRA